MGTYLLTFLLNTCVCCADGHQRIADGFRRGFQGKRARSGPRDDEGEALQDSNGGGDRSSPDRNR